MNDKNHLNSGPAVELNEAWAENGVFIPCDGRPAVDFVEVNFDGKIVKIDGKKYVLREVEQSTKKI